MKNICEMKLLTNPYYLSYKREVVDFQDDFVR